MNARMQIPIPVMSTHIVKMMSELTSAIALKVSLVMAKSVKVQ